MNLLDLDTRWKRFNDPDRIDPTSGAGFAGVFDIGFEEPQDWLHGARSSDDMVVGDDRLTPDLCRIGGRYFLRALLPLGLRGAQETFHFVLWVEITRAAFDHYLDSIAETSGFTAEGLTANDLPGFDDGPVPVALHADKDGSRPIASAQDGPLAEAQRDGISFDDLLDIYAASGRDIRPHLSA
ncbi:DUF2199 domain-containing protein [Sagittula sp. SSi028]|uniref:DUF2199 domain-containing protein n=1 Tax=Sagittula sp. SSi028 TaxID=3400636 RepID=UPI003AF99F20